MKLPAPFFLSSQSEPSETEGTKTKSPPPTSAPEQQDKPLGNMHVFDLEKLAETIKACPKDFCEVSETIAIGDGQQTIIEIPPVVIERDPIPVFEPTAKILAMSNDQDQLFTKGEMAIIAAARGRVGRWAKTSDRFDPFDQLYLTNMLRTNFYSDKLDAPVMDLEGALTHTCAIVAEWRAEDQMIAMEKRRVQNREAQQRFRKKVNSDPEIAAAEKAYRDALDQRRIAMEQWDDHIRALKESISHAKSRYEKRQSSRI